MEPNQTTYDVWDLPTRLLHWLNVITISGSLLSGMALAYVLIEGTPKVIKTGFMTVHLVLGYALAVSIAARLIWAFRGNRFARWPAVLPDRKSLAAVRSDMEAIARRRPHEYLGRSPLSRISSTLMFLLFFVQVGSGLGREWTRFYYPFAPIHNYSAFMLVALILVHIAGVTISETRQRSGVVSAMISGSKTMSETPIDAEE